MNMQNAWQSEPQVQPHIPRESEHLYADWFGVGGDLDDFIFYGEAPPTESGK